MTKASLSYKGGILRQCGEKCFPKWLQNPILSDKSRRSYDSISLNQWVAGFACIIRKESDSKRSNYVLEYMTDLIKDSQIRLSLLYLVKKDRGIS